MSDARATGATGAAGGRLSIARQLRWALLLLAIAAVPGVFVVSGARGGLDQLRAVHVLDADDAGRGPGTIVRGTLVSAPRDRLLTSERALWAGQLGAYEGSGKSRRYVVYCVLRGFDGAALRTAKGDVITLEGFDPVAELGTELAIDGRGPPLFDMSSMGAQGPLHPPAARSRS